MLVHSGGERRREPEAQERVQRTADALVPGGDGVTQSHPTVTVGQLKGQAYR